MSALLTIGVPIHNGEATLDRCLGSITAYAPEGVEVLMSDNASTDRTEAICREYASTNPAFRYVRQARNIGSMANFKFLLGEARTPYFMWLADDDWLGDEFVDRALAFMESHPDYVLASAAACAYYSRVNGEYPFTTLTCGIENDDPARSLVSPNDLVPFKANYSFTTLTSISALLQYNGQTGQFSSNVRFALLNRSGTGLFVVYNDRRDVLSSTALETLGRSFVVKYTRLIDF